MNLNLIYTLRYHCFYSNSSSLIYSFRKKKIKLQVVSVYKVFEKKILKRIIRENNGISMYEPRLNLRYYSHFGGRYHANHAARIQAGGSSQPWLFAMEN